MCLCRTRDHIDSHSQCQFIRRSKFYERNCNNVQMLLPICQISVKLRTFNFLPWFGFLVARIFERNHLWASSSRSSWLLSRRDYCLSHSAKATIKILFWRDNEHQIKLLNLRFNMTKWCDSMAKEEHVRMVEGERFLSKIKIIISS